MPGRRDYAAERARHEAGAAEKQRTLYDTLKAQLPEREHALVGQHAILAFLASTLGLTRPSGRPVTWRMVLRWTRTEGFPLLHGVWRPHHRTPSMSTSFACTAWALSRLDTDQRMLFRVHSPTEGPRLGTRPTPSVARKLAGSPGVGRGRWIRPLAVVRA